MTKYTLFRSNCILNKKNSNYPIRCVISSMEDLKAAVLYDHVSCTYNNNHRAKADFISADCVMMDLDNGHSDDPDSWKTIDDVAETFPDVEFCYIESRNHMKPKKTDNGEIKEPRPKYHLYFPIPEINDPEEYELIKKRIGAMFPYFDMKCADIAHFFYAVPNAEGDEVAGQINIADYLSALELKGALDDQINAALNDYHSHEDYAAISTWDAVAGYMAKPEGIDSADPDSDMDYLFAKKSVDKFHRDHPTAAQNILSEKDTRTHLFIYVRCPWCEGHTSEENETSTFISIDKRSGIINFHCNHTHCDDKRWKDYKQHYADIDRKEEPSNKKAPLIVRKMSEVIIKKTEFLFYPNFPRKLCIVSGYPGAGKTFLLCKLAAAVSTGKDFFQLKATSTDPANVIYFSSEDGYEDTIAPRLLQCGANMEYVSCVDFDDSSDFDFADSRLEDLIRELKPALVIFDTLQNFVGNVNMNAANETTRKMRPLVRIADTYDVCIVCICHFNKNEQGSAITRTIGSTDITGKCRSYMTIGPVPDKDNIKYLSHEKTNVGALGDTILFSIDRFGITYEGTSKMRADDYAMQRHGKAGRPSIEIDEIKDFIIRNMPENKRPANEMKRLLSANGFSDHAVNKAKLALGISSIKEGSFDNSTWYWVLPDELDEPRDYTEAVPFDDDG